MSHPRSLHIYWRRQVKVHTITELPTGDMPRYIQRSHCNNTGKRYEATENSSLQVSETVPAVLSVLKECSASHFLSKFKQRPLDQWTRRYDVPSKRSETLTQWRGIKSEDLNSKLQCCENLKPHNKVTA